MRLLQVVLLCFASGLSSGYPDGAPRKSCKFMLPGHTSLGFGRFPHLVSHQPELTSRYIINATWDEKYQYVRVSITGSIFRGFLVQARQTEEGQAIGNFKMLSNDTKYQDCTGPDFKFNPEASVTHTNATIKDNVTFLWEPPRTGKGNITFYATIAYSKEKFWLKLPSNKIELSAKSNRGSTVSMSLLANIVFLFLTLLFRTLST